jgi:stalled ribosome rescue protein Dom34
MFLSSNEPAIRRKYVDLVDLVRGKGAEVLIFSSMHESGQRAIVRCSSFHRSANSTV